MSSSRWQLIPGQGWGPVQLGLTLPQLLAGLKASGAEIELEDDDPEFLGIDDTYVELLWSDEDQDRDPSTSVVEQISTDDESWQPGGKPVIGERLDRALAALGVTQTIDTVWQLYADWNELYDVAKLQSARGDELETVRDRTASPEKLLTEGVLWCPSQALGIQMSDGLASVVLLRRPQHIPRRGYGPLTPEQLEMALVEGLADRLAAAERSRRRFPQRVATAIFLVVLGVVLYQSYQNQKRWHEAPTAAGRVVAVEPPTDGSGRDRYVVEYADPEGGKHQVRFTIADTYVPRAVGDEVEVRFLPEAPETAIGPAGLRDFWFLNWFPYIIGCFAVYAISLFFVGWWRK